MAEDRIDGDSYKLGKDKPATCPGLTGDDVHHENADADDTVDDGDKREVPTSNRRGAADTSEKTDPVNSNTTKSHEKGSWEPNTERTGDRSLTREHSCSLKRLSGRSHKRLAEANPPPETPDLKRSRNAPIPGLIPGHEYSLSRGTTADLREYIVAKFTSAHPNFSNDPEVRLFRDGEGTAVGRKKVLEKERIYIESHSGKQKMSALRKQGKAVLINHRKD